MPTLLENLVIDRVDLCDEGANSAAFIELFKRKEQQGMDLQELLSKMKPEHAKVIQDALDASATSLKEAQDKAAALAKSNSEVSAKLEAVSKELEDTKSKSGDDSDNTNKPHPDDCTCPECKAKKDRKSSGNTSFDSTETFKSLPAEAREYLDTLKSQKEAAETELRKALDEKAEADAVAKAQMLKAIPVEQNKLVDVIKKSTPEFVELLETINNAIEGTVLGEVGKTATDSDSGNNAWEKINTKAVELAKTNNISVAKAVSIVVSENPDLYKEYLEGGAN